MKEERRDLPKEQADAEMPRASRRQLLKLTAYTIPTIATLAIARKSDAQFSPGGAG